jgi:tetratricopeptide (TPR) repeat protein
MPDSGSGDHIDFRGSTFNGPVTGKVEYHRPGSVPVATATLPAGPIGFTGRQAELGELLEALSPGRDRRRRRWRLRGPVKQQDCPPVVISAISGLGGIGKTALALHAAHEAVARGWFPGGTLFVDLRGYDDDPVTAEQAVVAFLESLGMRNDDLPYTKANQSALLRSLLAERAERRGAMLLLLDNVSSLRQITDLLPNTGRHRVLITSRNRLSSLPARLVGLETMSTEDSVALVSTSLRARDRTDDRPEREPDALRQLAAVCGRLPLALQIAAALLSHRRARSIASLNDELHMAAERTGALESDGVDQYGKPLSLRPVFDVSYRRLPADQARLLRLMALAPTADVGTVLASAMAELDPEGVQAAPLLESLAAAHLVALAPERPRWRLNARAARWRLHDLVREYLREVVAANETLTQEAVAARQRLLSVYEYVVDMADSHLRRLPGEPLPEVFDSRAAALAWLDDERPELVAAVQWADQDLLAPNAVRIALNLANYLAWRRHLDDLVTVSQVARQRAQFTGNRKDEATAWDTMGNVFRLVERTQEAIDAHTRSRELYRALGDRADEARAMGNLGLALGQARRYEEAVEAVAGGRDLLRSLGDTSRVAEAELNLAAVLDEAGRKEESRAANDTALRLFSETGNRMGEAMALINVGLDHHDDGRPASAIAAYGRALIILQSLEDWHGCAGVHERIAAAHLNMGAFLLARHHWAQASAAYTLANAPAQAADLREWSRMTKRRLRRLAR